MKKHLIRLLLASALIWGVGYYVVPLFFPLPERLTQTTPQGLLLVDRHGMPIRQFLSNDQRTAPPASFDEFPNKLIEATIAVEDARFYSHGGVDFIGLARAIRDGLVHRKIVSGASTITQQTIKLYSDPRPRTLKTKLIEIFTARKLEMFADKRTILTAYLNRLPYGNQYIGPRAAAQGYFGKPLSDLSSAEAALLAGIPNKPTRFNPWLNFAKAKERQAWVFKRMTSTGVLSPDEATRCQDEALNLLPGPAQTFRAPHFVELVRSHHPEAITSNRALKTTLDLALQTQTESILSSELVTIAFKAKEQNNLQAAAVIIENATGDVLALAGSRSFFGSESGQINGAWTPRSAGSTLKPFTYLLALDQHYHAASILADTPIEYITSTGTYQPVNFDRQFHGPVSIRHALANSLNVPAVKLLNEIGGPPALHRLLQDQLHFSSLKSEPTAYGLGLTLGNAEVRLLELTNAYACLARLGAYRPYRLIQQGLVGDPTLFAHQLFDQSHAWLIADILSDNAARSEAFGLHSPLSLPFRCAAKTGTSTDFRDNWAIGYTPDYTVGVWMGRFSNQPLKEISGANGAAHLFHRLMTHLHHDQPATWFDPPKSAERRLVDALSGQEPPQNFTPKRSRQEWFVNGNLPSRASIDSYSADGKTMLSHLFTHWWNSDANDLRNMADIAPLTQRPSTPDFRIVSPLQGTVAFLDPDLPQQGSKFPLQIAGSGHESIRWESDSLAIENDGDRHWIILKPGKHSIHALDPSTGHRVTTSLEVKAL